MKKFGLAALCMILILAGFILGYSFGRKRVKYTEKIAYTEPLPEYTLLALSERLQTDDPLGKIKEDLISKPELIPYEGELGGKMGFYAKNDIRIINDKWVSAYFEDGHNGGYIFLEYEIDQNGLIYWKRLDSFLY